MKVSTTKNKTCRNISITFVEVGDELFFGGLIQKTYLCTEIRNGRAFSNKIDLFELSKKEQPICLTNNEFTIKTK